MALTPKIKKEINERITPHIKNCPLCGHKELKLKDHIAGFSVHESDPIEWVAGNIYATILFYCTNCYHILAFDAVHAGIIPPS